MVSHPVDYFVYGGGWGTEEGRDIFSEEQTIDRWLKIEAALAEVEAKLGIIPAQAAREISSCASVKKINLNIVKDEHLKTRHTLIPVLRALSQVCKHGAREYIHFGPTTQDIVDTGAMLALKAVFELIQRDLVEIQKRLCKLTREHAETPMVGRTHGGHALPITFGFKTAIWFQDLKRHLDRLEQCRNRVLVGSLSGGVGSYASLGDLGRKVERMTLAKLALGVAEMPWHSSRDRIAEAALLLAMICSTMGKIGGELYLLQKTEVAEVTQGYTPGLMGSSTMPNKLNPETAEGIKALSKLVRYRAAGILEAMEVEHERESCTWKTEWVILPEVCIYTLGALAKVQQLLEGLVVNPDSMRANLNRTKGLIMSERVMFALAERLGKQTAHELMYEASMATMERGEDLTTVLLADARVRQALSEEAIKELLNPVKYTGLCGKLAREAISNMSGPGT